MHRVLTQVHRNFEAAVPDPGDLDPQDHELMTKTDAALDAVASSFEATHFREALNAAMGLARETNRYLDTQAPWKQVKEDRQAAARSLYTSLYAISGLKVILYPFIPFSAQRLHELMGLSGKVESVEWAIDRPEPGRPIPEPSPLFTKLDDSVAAEMVALLG